MGKGGTIFYFKRKFSSLSNWKKTHRKKKKNAPLEENKLASLVCRPALFGKDGENQRKGTITPSRH